MLRRTTNDISYSWKAVVQNLDTQENVPRIHELAGPSAFNDPDMLMFGHPKAELSAAEAASHLALWAILKAPLLLSTSIDNLTTGELSMLTNVRLPLLPPSRVPGLPCAVAVSRACSTFRKTRWRLRPSESSRSRSSRQAPLYLARRQCRVTPSR